MVRNGVGYLRFRFSTITTTVLLILFVQLGLDTLNAQPRSEYRAFWVDTFNTTLNNHNDIVTVVQRAKAAKANAIFAQVRRRGDSWYLNSLEPRADRQTFSPSTFDPLLDLIAEAHKPENGMEVHAFVIVSAIWNRDPRCATLQPPAGHAFISHGGFNSDPTVMNIDPNRAGNWLTRSLLPDSVAHQTSCPAAGTPIPNISFNGQRFGSEFWLDLGHPDAAAYTVDVLMHLVRNYDIDGLHLDRIRYPEFAASSQTPSNGTNIGYNVTNVNRFNTRHNRSGNPLPSDNLWKQWRRDQVTNVVRRVYLNAIAIKPQIKISAALIAFSAGPTTEASWSNAEAFWRVYQDWRAWTEEGIIDIAIPMAYKREHNAEVTQFNQWNEWLKNHQYNRAGMIGQGSFINSVEGTLRQTRRALEPSVAGNSSAGIIFFSMATSNVAVGGNPFTSPAGQTTPARPFAEFASGLVTGKSVNGATLYESQAPPYAPIFAEAATIPVFSWKSAPVKGHLMGLAKRSDNTTLDTAAVTITNVLTNASRSGATDGGGFYGGVDLAPGDYLLKAELGSEKLYSCVATVSPGIVTTADLSLEDNAPITTAVLTPAVPNGLNGWYTSDVQLALNGSDSCSGVARTEYSLDGHTWLPYAAPIQFNQDGVFTVVFRSTDRATNAEIPNSLTIKIDKTAPTGRLSASPSEIFPPNGNQVFVTLTGNGSDATSGLDSVSYSVTDEYGTALNVSPRSLVSAANWTDTLNVEARRNGDDRDGRLYRVSATVRDAAGNTTTASADIIVLHDRRP